MRGPLGPRSVPIVRSRSAQFDELVLDAVDRLQPRWREQLAAVEFGVEDVPSELSDGPVPLAAALPAIPARPASSQGSARPASPARIVVYRRPVELRAPSRLLLRLLVNDVVVEQVASLLGVDPGQVDPDYFDPDDDPD
jgi:predicted Zn-dependent protease with MMP-like domain